MKNLLIRYNEIMKMYKQGEFGEEHLTMSDILEKAGEPDLFDKMCLSELHQIIQDASGMTKQMFCYVRVKRAEDISNMQRLENELKTFNIRQYCDSENVSDAALAKKLNLAVRYYDCSEMPEDVEATLSPLDSKKHYGVIKILNDCRTGFSYMHEIIHYLRDVGVGERVMKEYTRKRKGKTDSVEEQEINYLTAAAVMPIERIYSDLKEYENINCENEENRFLEQMATKYGQDLDAISRRFTEVRCLIDAGYKIA